MSNIEEFCFTLEDETSKDSTALLIEIQNDFQQPLFADLDIYDNLFGSMPVTNDLPSQSDYNAEKAIDGTSPDVEHSLKAFCVQRVHCTNPLQDFPTILETTEHVVTSTIEPESPNINLMNADNNSQTQTEVNWSSSNSEPQINVANGKRLVQVIPKRLQEYASGLLMRMGLSVNNNIQYVNNGYGIVNPKYRKPISGSDQCLTCPACNITFGQFSKFNRHMSQHTSDKRYLCVICGKAFHDLYDLKRHTRIHTGVRPYQCTQCGCSFTQLNSLEKHKSTKHWLPILYGYKQRRRKLYVCEQCGESTNDAELHEYHVEQCSALA